MSVANMIDNPATIILGHTPGDNQSVQEDLRAQGLRFLRAKPADMQAIGVPDYIQFRYNLFKGHFSSFMGASTGQEKNQVWTMQGQDRMIKSNIFDNDPTTDTFILPPISPVTIVLAYKAEPSEEVWANLIKDEKKGTELKGSVIDGSTAGGKKRAILFTPENWSDYKNSFQGHGCDQQVEVAYNQVNPIAWSCLKNVVSAVFAGVHAIRYPAWKDAESVDSFMEHTLTKAPKIQVQDPSNTGMNIDGDDNAIEEIKVPLSGESLSKTNHLTNHVIDYTPLPKARTFVNIDSGSDIPADNSGLWFPYFSRIADFDHRPVTAFLENHCKLLFGSTHADAMRAFNMIVGYWKGISSNTECGKELSHIAFCLNLALDCQAQILPCFRRGKYAGSMVVGFAFTVQIKEKFYRPVVSTTLVDAVFDSDLHSVALDRIAQLVVEATYKDKVENVKSMHELAILLKRGGVKQTDIAEVTKLAGMLDFGHRHWNSSLPNLQNALRLISDNSFSLRGELRDRVLPLHYSQIFSDNRVNLVWSCFGAQAPSFRVPQGKKFELRKDMEFTPRGAKKSGKDSVTHSLVRIYVRQKTLEQAIRDIEWVLEEQAIENPTEAPRAKASQQNIDKSFSGANGTALYASLRLAAGVNISSSGKGRGRDEDNDETNGGPSKRQKDVTAIDLDL